MSQMRGIGRKAGFISEREREGVDHYVVVVAAPFN